MAPWRISAARQSSRRGSTRSPRRSEEHTSELQSRSNLVCRLLLEKKVKRDTGWTLCATRRTRLTEKTVKSEDASNSDLRSTPAPRGARIRGAALRPSASPFCGRKCRTPAPFAGRLPARLPHFAVRFLAGGRDADRRRIPDRANRRARRGRFHSLFPHRSA